MRLMERSGSALFVKLIAVVGVQCAVPIPTAVVNRTAPGKGGRKGQPIREPLTQLRFEGIVVGIGDIHLILDHAVTRPRPARSNTTVVAGAGPIDCLIK